MRVAEYFIPHASNEGLRLWKARKKIKSNLRVSALPSGVVVSSTVTRRILVDSGSR